MDIVEKADTCDSREFAFISFSMWIKSLCRNHNKKEWISFEARGSGGDRTRTEPFALSNRTRDGSPCEGEEVSSAEIAAVLWEDKEYTRSIQAQTQKAISQLTNLLERAGIEDIVKRGWNSISVVVGQFSCDYYEHLQHDNEYTAINAGEYMSEYSWGEVTAGYLSRKNK